MSRVLAILESVAPGLAARYYARRLEVADLKRLYDAAQASQYHRPRTQIHSGDGVMDHATHKLRAHARYLDENHDLAVSVLDTLVNRTVGAGLTPAPMVRTRGGELHEDANKAISAAWLAWSQHPDTEREQALPELQRLICRTWLRDGELLLQHLEGGRFPHRGPVPYTIETLEADYLPFELNGAAPRIVHGVEKGLGGMPVAYHLLREHPGDTHGSRLSFDTVRIPADRVAHLKFTRRLRQTRGVSVFHAVLRRLEDLKEYEESERIAARVAAAFTGYIRKAGDYSRTQTAGAAAGSRQFEMQPGLIFDGLVQGEDIGTIESNRPNTALEAFVGDQIRRIAGGTGTGASSISRNYSQGSYSAQRQEIVDIDPAYARLHNYFVHLAVRQPYERFVQLAELAGVLRFDRDVDRATILAFECPRPVMPWVDPSKEVKADVEAVDAGFKSRYQVIRERGGDPRRVDAEREQDTFQPAKPAAPAGTPATPTDPDDDEEAKAA